MCDVYREASFSPQSLYNGLTMSLPRQARIWKIVYGVKTHWLSGEEKVLAAVKNVMLTVFWVMEGSITIHFFEKGATVSSAFYCQLPMKNSSC